MPAIKKIKKCSDNKRYRVYNYYCIYIFFFYSLLYQIWDIFSQYVKKIPLLISELY
ncbi:hypothetical protein MOSE0_N05908 [Monosporozyma servazzii]